MENTEMERLEALASWAEKSGQRGVIVKVTDLVWAVDRLRLLHEIIGGDIDIDGQLGSPAVCDEWPEEIE